MPWGMFMVPLPLRPYSMARSSAMPMAWPMALSSSLARLRSLSSMVALQTAK